MPTEGTTLEQAEADLDMVIRDFIKDGVDENQLQRIKAQIRASEIYAMDDVFGLARTYGAALTSQLSIEDVKEWPKLLGEVSSEQVLEAARTLEVDAPDLYHSTTDGDRGVFMCFRQDQEESKIFIWHRIPCTLPIVQLLRSPSHCSH